MTATKPSALMTRLDALALAAGRPVSACSLRVYRAGLGLLVAFGFGRFLAYGWVEELYLKPRFQFHYWPLGSLTPAPGAWLYGVMGLGIISALSMAAGLKHRLSVGLTLLCFLTVEVLDKTLYLNHYVLVSLLLALLWFMPLAGASTAPVWCVWALRAQAAAVYLHAALAKWTPDWLLRGEPLGMWLRTRAEVPVLGAWLAAPGMGLAMSWAGMLFDLTIVGLLLWRRTRALGLALVVCFHGLTWLLFPIGIFPWVMILGSTLFLSPRWPEQLAARWRPELAAEPGAPRAESAGWRPMPRAALTLGLSFALLQAALPLRSWLYPGVVHWHEQGYRFAWKVMLNEKTGDAVFTVDDPQTGQRSLRLPSQELTPLQEKMMSTQPDMILQYAHHLAQEHQRQTGRWPRVYAQVWVSWNGRRAAPLVDPEVDLAQRRDGLAPYAWVLPAPP